MHFLPRDFIETCEGLFFAVVDAAPEDGQVLCFLRYGCIDDQTVKLDTVAAYALLESRYPGYLYYSRRLDAPLHAVPAEKIKRHHEPRARLQQLLACMAPDALQAKLQILAHYLISQGVTPESLGVTGSLLVARQHAASDIDLVLYDRNSFFLAKQAVVAGIETGALRALDETDWRAAWDRRGCALDFETFVWHERRKGNKGMIEDTKFDLALVVDEPVQEDDRVWLKQGSRQIQARILDDTHAYDQPARYALDHAEIGEILCFTHTYVGQARPGEMIAACGMLELSNDGSRRLVVGSSREAPGEYIRVLWDV